MLNTKPYSKKLVKSRFLSGKTKLFFLLSIICLTLSVNLSSATPLSVSLTPSNHNGYSISCFGGRDGAVNITVSGGTFPYTFVWSTGATTQNISAQPSGYYVVTVTDAVLATVSGNVTLTEPTALTLTVTPSNYAPQTTNISCYNCCNGYINTTANGGVTAYSYSWSSGQTIANITNLCKNIYTITVTDANGCNVTDNKTMTEPDKDAWGMAGNSGSNPSTQFVGTTDSVDFVLKTKSIERARVKANGDFKIDRLITNRIVSPDSLIAFGDSTIWINATNQNIHGGIVSTNKGLGLGDHAYGTGLYSTGIGHYVRAVDDNSIIIGSGYGTSSYFRNTVPNSLMVGFNSDQPTLFISPANGVNTVGSVCIGGTYVHTDYILAVKGKILAEEVHVKNHNNWPDYVFADDYHLKSISELKEFIDTENHLPGLPSAKTVEKEGFDLGDMQAKLLQKIEELTLYIIKQDERIEKLEKSNAELKGK